VGNITVIRDARDLNEMVDALLVQGAAAHIAFEPDEFATGERAAPFRTTDGAEVGQVVNLAWMRAMALAPERQFVRSDVADGAAFPELRKATESIGQLQAGELTFKELGEGTEIVIDGVPLSGAKQTQLRPGIHWVHVLRNDVLSGRSKIEIKPGSSTVLPVLVDFEEATAARKQVLLESVDGFPDDVNESLKTLAAFHKGRVFVAARDGNKVIVLPLASGAELLSERVVTVVSAAEIGFGLVISPLFDQANGNNLTAPGASGNLSMELGVYNFAVVGGLDLAFTPPFTITHANRDNSGNVPLATFAYPWGGLGGYPLRPTGQTPSLLILATYGWEHPAHLAYGGRVSLGIPLQGEEGRWLRFTVGGASSPKPMKKGFEQVPMHTLFFRMGLAGLF
jgi:hypothetical protein